MFARMLAATFALALACAVSASAQELAEPGGVEFTVVTAGGARVAAKRPSPGFGTFLFGTAFTYNINRFLGVEGDVGAMLPTSGEVGAMNFSGSQFRFALHDSQSKPPNFLHYDASAIVTAARVGRTRIYGAAGVGGLTMFRRSGLGVTENETFGVGNVGGGVKWYGATGRWGIRGDYRLLVTKAKDDAAAFFGQENRVVHRVYAGVILKTAG